MKNNKCKICRRAGTKLFLKGEKCFSPKCPVLMKPYPPGLRTKKRRRGGALSEYGKELREKQKLKNWYNLGERQFRKYVKEVLAKRRTVSVSGESKNTADLLIEKLESRFDNAVFRLGFAASRNQARQRVTHGHFLLNGKPMNIPSHLLKKGDKIGIKPQSLKKPAFQNLHLTLKKHKTPSWLELDAAKSEGKVIGKPTLTEADPPAEISAIFEFYSR